MTPLRVGILGTGYMGRLHARNLRTFPDVALTACCARTQEQAADFSREETAGQAVAYADFSHMLHESPLDALYICLPPFAHTGQTEQAAAAGLHLFLEKPLALTEAHAATMVAAIERAGVVSQVGYHQRFGAAVERARAMIVDGMAGRPTLFQASYECNALHSAWWRDQTRSGGQVFEQVIHQYDLAHFFLGPAQLVTGFVDNLCHRQYADYTVDDTSVAAIRFTSGAMASIIGSNCAVPMEWRSAFHLICERLTVHFTSPNDAEFIFTEGGAAVRENFTAERDLYLAETANFLAAIRGEEPALAPARDGLQGVRLVSAVLTSARNFGQPVSVLPG